MKNCFFLVFAICMINMSVSAQIPGYLDTSGLVAFFNFDNSTSDSYVYQNHGYGTGLSPTTDRFANATGAFSFDGIASYIAVPGTPSISEFPVGQTISVWLKLDLLPTDNREHYILWKQHDFPFSFYHLFISDFANAEQLMYRYGNSSVNTAYGPTAYNNIPVNQWFHYIITTNLTHTYCYVNGIQVSDSLNDQNAMFGVNTDSLFIGTNMDGDPNRTKYQGAMDDLAIYNRYMDACEVKRMFHSQLYAATSDTVDIGDNGMLTINTVDTGQFFQWQEDAGSGYVNLANNATYSGVNTTVLMINNTTVGMNGYLYRCIVENNGCVDTSLNSVLAVIDPAGIDDFEKEQALVLYPNPTLGVVYIRSDETINSIAILGMDGRTIVTLKCNGKNAELDMSDLIPGLYTLRINESSYQILSRQ